MNPGDLVIVRNQLSDEWVVSIFSHFKVFGDGRKAHVCSNGHIYQYCMLLKNNEKQVGSTHASTADGYVADQKKWIEETGCQAGSIVEVTGVTTSYANGWQSTWNSGMNNYLGCYGMVQNIKPAHGLQIAFNSQSANRDMYHYPYFCLEVVKP